MVMKRQLVIFPLTAALGLAWFTFLGSAPIIAGTFSSDQSSFLTKGRKPVFQSGIPSGGTAGTPPRAVPDEPSNGNSNRSLIRGLPGRPEGAGVRPNKPAVDPRLPRGGQAGAPRRAPACLHKDSKPLMALLPLSESNLAFTTSVHPTFYVYVPPRVDSRPTAEFKVINNEGKTIFQESIALGDKSGVMGFQLPQTAAPLMFGQDYRWEFILVCVPGNPSNGISSENLTVGAKVQRIKVDPDLANQLSKATPDKKAELYAQQGIWYDLLATMAELRLEEPGNTQISKYWIDLFNQDIVDLETVANEPVLPVQVLADSTQVDSWNP